MTSLLVNLGALGLIALIIWWFWMSRPQARRAQGAQPIEILVDNGVYTPARIEVPVGRPVTLRFVRKDPSPCAEKVLFDELGVSAYIRKPFSPEQLKDAIETVLGGTPA